MIPVVKGWSTESAIDIASLGVQIHGGMGFIEETGAAQHLRDARITTIYEGTTGIQAADLIGRKIARDGGATIRACDRADARSARPARRARTTSGSRPSQASLRDGIDSARTGGAASSSTATAATCRSASVGAVPFLELFGIVAGGWQMARAALVAHRRLSDGGGDPAFHRAKLETARFYADHVLARAPGLAHTVVHGAESALAIEDDQF